jgi:HK97 family phage portal protein
MYSSQVDLDRAGNAVSIILARDGQGLPSLLEPVPASSAIAVIRDRRISKWRIGGTEYEPEEIWHEKQYTVAGLPVGLSPVAYAALALGEYASIQQFATDWFDNGTLPSATLKNTERVIPQEVADQAKARYKATVANGDVFVMGADWEFSLMKAEAAATDWLGAKQFGLTEISRFFDCPADLIDAAVSGSSVTYANLTQRNLQFLIMSLGPAVARREGALSDLLPRPRFVKLNTDALLRMDPEMRARVLGQQVKDRLRTPSEARELDNLAPFDEADLAEFDRIFGPPPSKAGPTPVQASSDNVFPLRQAQ